MRGTTASLEYACVVIGISTHVPHAGHDCHYRFRYVHGNNFNSRAPCGARLGLYNKSLTSQPFQLTCPMRGTTRAGRVSGSPLAFQLTCPMRGTTWAFIVGSEYRIFQLTCPMRGTTKGDGGTALRRLFQLTCPMRGTTGAGQSGEWIARISTHVPHAGHDFLANRPTSEFKISTHVPHAGHDGETPVISANATDFNSRAPCGARRNGHL